MSDLRGCHGRNFSGCYLQVAGDDEKLNTFLDQMDYIARAIVLSRTDTTEGKGSLTIQCAKATVRDIQTIATKDGLAVTI